MKRLLLFFTLFLALPSISFAFSDVPQNHLFAEEIAFVAEKGLVNGYADGTFGPEKTINRAEFAKIVVSSLYSKEEIEKCDTEKFSFPDVEKNAWYVKFVCKAKEKGLINGYKDGNFLPDGNISFAETAKILVNGFLDPIESQENEWWANPFIEKLQNTKNIYSSLISPITRVDVANFLWNLEFVRKEGHFFVSPHGIYQSNRLIDNINIDINSFHYIKDFFYKDKNTIYYSHSQMNWLIPLKNVLEKDVQNEEKVVLDAHNKIGDYLYYNEICGDHFDTCLLENVDFQSFVCLDRQSHCLYTKDKNNVYMRAVLVKDADVKTFQYLGADESYESYAKDKNHYYKNNEIITEEEFLKIQSSLQK